MISVVTFKWKPKPGYRSNFMSGHVNVLRRMVARHYQKPHRFLCITDDPKGLDKEIEAIPLWDDHASIPNPTWPDGPSCYRRLKVFSKEFEAIAGPRFVCMDIDMVITADLSPIFDRTEPFLVFKTHLPNIPVCGSMFMMDAGSQSFVWEQFDPKTSPALASRAGCRGSDQGWLTYCYRGLDAIPGWGEKEGVYSYMQLAPKLNLKRRGYGAFQHRVTLPKGPLPPDARIVVFTGKPDPWDHLAREQSPWIDEHYR